MGQVQTKIENKKLHKFETNEDSFIRNGAILLEKQIALSHGQHVAGQLKIFSRNEIKNATNNYDRNLIALKNREAYFYKGTLDGRLVYIKTPSELEPNYKLADLFLTEVSISMVIRHDNMNKIYGCCLETYIPIIVYHRDSKCRTLNQWLHGDLTLRKRLKWKGRLNVLIDVAYALSYMHNALSKPVVHRDVKPIGIITDSSFNAMLGNLAHSVSINPEKNDQRWPVQGTPGYTDPEYIESGKVSDKCDVYNYGVLMLELLTGMDPSEMAKCGKNLVDEFVSGMERNGIKKRFDMSVLEEGNMDEIQRFAQLALRCLARKGDERPTMINVVEELWQIQDNQEVKLTMSTENTPGLVID